MKRIFFFIIVLTIPCWPQAQSSKQYKKEQKELAKQAARLVPSAEIAAPADKVKALILTRISQLDFALINDSAYQLSSVGSRSGRVSGMRWLWRAPVPDQRKRSCR
jgi:hypothetical protein